MTHSHWLRLCLVFAIVSLAAVVSAVNLPSSTSYPGTSTALEVSRTSPEHTAISLSGSEITANEVMIDYQSYQEFRLPGEPVLFAEGKPSVPQVSRFYRIPNTGGVELQISDTDYELLETVEALPVQIEGKEFHGLVRDDNVYSRDEWYPANVAEISAPLQMRDFRVVVVNLYPVQVNPVTRQARVYHTLSVEIVANNTPGPNEIVTSRPPSGAWVETYRALIPNLEDDALLDARRTPGSYLIICKNNAQPLQWVDSLRLWKTRQGYDVVVDARGNWTANNMVTAIQTAYATWDSPLEFVCLIGDPQWTNGVPTGGGGYPAGLDHIFALGNAGDDIEDIGVGRLSGSTMSEMATINAKIMAYERNPQMTDSAGNADTTWFHRALFLAGTAHNQPANVNLHRWCGNQIQYFTGVDSTYYLSYTNSVNTALVVPYFNSGLGYFFWQGTWIGELSESFPSQLTPTRKLPVVIAMSEGSNSFDNGLGVAESFLTAGTAANLKGGVCAIGSAYLMITWAAHAAFTAGFDYALAASEVEHVSTAMSYGKFVIGTTYGFASQTSINYQRMINLMGEPSLSMWTDVPAVMSVEHPDSVPVGTQTVRISVQRDFPAIPVEDALVVLWKENETFARVLTDAGGEADLPVTINTTGDLLLTVTKRNHKPYLFTIPCVNSAQNVGVCVRTMDDDNTGGTQGNDNGQINPGETIDLTFWLRNFGTETIAGNIVATLESENSHVIIVDGASGAPDLAPGDSAMLFSPLRVHISPAMRHEEIAPFTLNISTSQAVSQSRFELECAAGATEYVSHDFEGEFGPGMTQNLRVTLRNRGAEPLSNLSAQLTSLGPFVSVLNGTADFGTLNPGEEITNTDQPFVLMAASIAHRGYPARMRLVTSTPAGPLDTMEFVLSIGTADSTDPTGPDAYGYFAYDNSDTAYTNHPGFEYIDISDSLGTNLNLNDPGIKTLPIPVYSVAHALPFPFRFYGQEYDTITICSNGWVAFGNQSWNDCFRNFSIPGILAPDAMIAAYWDDLDTFGNGLGVWAYADTTNHRYIVQWKARGATQQFLLDFEVVLYDQAFYPTADHNGMAIVQYDDVTMNLTQDYGEPPGSTIGIQAPGATSGLEYVRGLTYAPGAAAVHDGRAILFTTTSVQLMGGVAGVVTDAATGSVLPDVTISLNDPQYLTQTNDQGRFHLDSVLVSRYVFKAHLARYNDFSVPDLEVWQDSTVIINPALLHPELALSVDTIAVTLPANPPQTSFAVSNAGNGPLDCILSVEMADTTSHNLWDSLLSVPAGDVAQDAQILGCEYFFGDWWLSGGFGPHGGNNLYRFGANGELIESLPQPGNSEDGWFDLATDGDYLYGSDSAAIVGVDTTGNVQRVIPSPLNPATAIAYDPERDHFWIAAYFTDIYEINRAGQIVHQLDNQTAPLMVTGLAWYGSDPQGFRLYVFSADGNGPEARLTRMNPITGVRETVADVPGLPAEHAGGCAITHAWNGATVFAAIMQNNASDYFRVYLLDSEIAWISVSPQAFSVPGGEQRLVSVNFDTEGLVPAAYHARLKVSNSVLDTVAIIPVTLVIEGTPAKDAPPEVPTEFALYQNYPNPFNPTTEISFDLPISATVELSVYNTLGQRVATLLEEPRSAGRHQVTWDATRSASGVYLYQIKAGHFIATRKMILLR